MTAEMLSLSNWKQFKRHELSELLPDMDDATFETLVNDMKRDGYDNKQQIILYDGRVLDGWHRLRAAVMTEVKMPTFDVFKGTYTEAIMLVVRRNLTRRHLNDSQRAMVAATIANLGEGRPQKTPPAGGVSQISAEKAANLLNVSGRSVERASSVQTNGTDVLKEAVKDGSVTLTDAAKVASQPPKVQNKAVADVRNGKARTASAAVLDREPGCEPDPEVDHFKKAVPDDVQEVFATVESYRSVLAALAKARTAVEEIAKGKGKRFLDAQETDRLIKQAHANLRFAMPYTECVKCRRKVNKECKHCRGGGWLNEATFKACATDADRKWLEDRK